MELYELFRRHSRISTDSRHIVPDSLFFALHGERFDGNSYAENALKAGAAAVQGEVQCAFELFGAKVTITGSGSLGSAQAELTYSHKNREWEFGSKLGFIAGLGFHVKVEY